MSTLALYVNDSGVLVKVINGQEYVCSTSYSYEVAELIFARQGHTSMCASLHDARALPVLSKTLYRDLRKKSFSKEDLISLSGELLNLVAVEIREERNK